MVVQFLMFFPMVENDLLLGMDLFDHVLLLKMFLCCFLQRQKGLNLLELILAAQEHSLTRIHTDDLHARGPYMVLQVLGALSEEDGVKHFLPKQGQPLHVWLLRDTGKVSQYVCYSDLQSSQVNVHCSLILG